MYSPFWFLLLITVAAATTSVFLPHSIRSTDDRVELLHRSRNSRDVESRYSTMETPNDDNEQSTNKHELTNGFFILLCVLFSVILIVYFVVKCCMIRRRCYYGNNDTENLLEVELKDMKKTSKRKQKTAPIITLMPIKEESTIERGMDDPSKEINSNGKQPNVAIISFMSKKEQSKIGKGMAGYPDKKMNCHDQCQLMERRCEILA